MADLKISQLTGATTPLAGTEELPLVQTGATKKVSVANLTAGRAMSALSYATGATAQNVTVSGVDFTAGGTDADVGLSFKPKGYGAVNVYNSSDADARVMISGNGVGGDPFFRMYDRVGALNLEFQADTGVASRSFTFFGNTTVTTGNLVIGTSGKGIDFAASGGDVLAHYDEGTFTPTDASGAGLTFVSASAKYTRIGRQVFVKLTVEFPTTADASGITIGGLPYTSSNDSLGSVGTVLCNANLLCVSYVGPAATTIRLFDGANLNDRLNVQFSAKTAIISISYFV